MPSGQQACVIFNHLTVNNIEDSSGIFIGTNRAYGWSTTSKSNQGFGNLRDASVTHSFNVVQDSDLVDASVKDIRHIALTETPSSLQQCAIGFQTVQVTSVNNGSAIDLGDNKQLGWRNSHKVNYGSGKHMGSNQVSRAVNILWDNDIVDAPIQTTGSVTELSSAVKNIRIEQNPPE